MLVTALLLTVSPVAAQAGHGGHGGGVPVGVVPGWVEVALRVVLLTGTAVVAGLGLLRLFTGRVAERTVVVAAVAAVLTAASLVMPVFLGIVSVLLALPQAVVTLMAPIFLSRRPRAAGLAGLLLVTALVVEATLDQTGVASGVAIGHTLAAVALIAVAVLVAGADAADRRELVGRFWWVAVAGVVVLAGTGLVQAWLAHLRLDAVSAGSMLGRLVVLKVVLVAAAVATGVIALRRGGARAYRAGAVLLTAALATGAVLAAAPALPAPAPAGQPVLRTITLNAGPAQMVVVPHRPGPNLVWISSDGYTVGTSTAHLVPATTRPGSPGGWAVVDLPAGPSELWITHVGERTALRLDADPAVPALPAITGPNGPECLTAVVGSAIAGGPTPKSCPGERLDPADATALRGTIRSLADRGVPGIRLVTGDSARSAAAAAVVTTEAARAHIRVNGPADPNDARVVVSGWPEAEQALITQNRSPVNSGVYLAPWLANGTLLGYSTGAVVALNFDTTDDTARAYVDALDGRATRALASPAGYHTWLTTTGRPQPTGPARLYAAIAGFDIMGAGMDMHGAATGGWIPAGRLTAVSQPLT